MSDLLRLTKLVAAALFALLSASASDAGRDPVVCIDEDHFQRPPVAPSAVRLDTGLARAIYEGATPPGYDPESPILVFVHGLNGFGREWFSDTTYHGRNDMYDAAYAAGYKTFYVDLLDVGGDSGSGVENGLLLKSQIEWITDYWGVDRVNVVAHSKGGVDTNIAVAFGAPVDTMFTLAGAHYGSPLADLAQTDWLEWLAELVGQNDPGIKFLQTGCMDEARAILDSRNQNGLSIYTSAGTSWGPFLSALEFGGLYLALACPNFSSDGLVCLEHAQHPLARNAEGIVDGEHRLIWSLGDYELDHDNIRRGTQFFDFFWWWQTDCYVPIFDSIEPYIERFHADDPNPRSGSLARNPRSTMTEQLMSTPLSLLLRGGRFSEQHREFFPVEVEATRLSIRLLLSDGETQAAWIDPTGKRHIAPPTPRLNSGLLRGTSTTGLVIDDPSPGVWTLELVGDGGYTQLAHIDSSLDLALEIQRLPDAARLELLGAARKVRFETAERRVSLSGDPDGVARRTIEGTSAEVRLPEDGIYNAGLTIHGVSPAGTLFERSHVLSLRRGEGSGALPEACQ